MHLYKLAVALLLSSVPAAFPAQVLTPDISATIDGIRRNASIPGYAVAIVRLGAETEFGNWGNATEDGVAMTEDTLISIASCSKAFTATALGVLMEDFAHGRNVTLLPPGVGGFTWDTKVGDLLPGDWKLEDQWASEKASLRDVLAHVSGVPAHDFSYRPNDSPSNFIQRMRYLSPAYELRQELVYTNQMYMTAAHIISLYSNKSFEDFVRNRIFVPLGMNSSTYSPAEASSSGKFTQSWSGSVASSEVRRIPSWLGEHGRGGAQVLAGAGGTISSTRELALWVSALLDTNSTALPRVVVDETLRAQSIFKRDAAGAFGIATYGFGWIQFTLDGTGSIVLHNGGLPGVSSLIVLLPDYGFGVVLLANLNGRDDANFEVLSSVLAQVALDGTDAAAGPVAQVVNLAKRAVIPKQLVHLPRTETTRPHARADASAAPAILVDKLAGTYANAGYETVTLCTAKSSTGECKAVLAAFPDAGATANDTLYASFDRIWVSHLRLRASQPGVYFTAEALTPFPHGYGMNTSAFEVSEGTVPAEFDIDAATGHIKGFGLFGLVGGDEQVVGDTPVEQRAGVYFSRV